MGLSSRRASHVLLAAAIAYWANSLEQRQLLRSAEAPTEKHRTAETSTEQQLDEVPIIDLACTACDLVAEVDAALLRYGFFYVRNHSVHEEAIAGQFEQSRLLFDLPDEVKRGLAFNASLDIGYTGGSGTSQALDPTKPAAADTKEGFMLTNNGVMLGAPVADADPLAGATLLWPPGLDEYQAKIRRYFAQAYALNRRLNAMLFAALRLDEAERERVGSAPFCVLKQLRYSPAASHDGRASGAAADGLGAGAHADWGAFTVLATDGTPGLQVELDGMWLPVPPKDGCLIVNAGDQIEMLTNGHYRSAKHRVVVAPNASAPRFSAAFFTYFNYHATITPLTHLTPDEPSPRWPPMDTHDWFQYKLRQSVGENIAKPGVLSGE